MGRGVDHFAQLGSEVQALAEVDVVLFGQRRDPVPLDLQPRPVAAATHELLEGAAQSGPRAELAAVLRISLRTHAQPCT